MMRELNRSELNRALAKAIAYQQCGKQRMANAWAARLIYLLDTMDIMDQKQLGPLLTIADADNRMRV
jgi:hypothetical protein